ncbi:hypothetical protein [Saccharolobus caldissimus]|uniref:Uncharacterized protein n=1 Tax=Saccharolobus caldissimus TaxID=1702097 RepID=A0AAQ4CUX0_9CREN|nr:hypothetical protein [Saccharolobus caldissimus]BDB99601.1 hypothetical protein SACC_26180 [Saccharolobus caldissimus]
MKVMNPLFYFFIFLYSTVILPIIVNGIRVLKVWYGPLADTGQITFLYPFLTFTISTTILSVILGYTLYRKKSSRFILIRGPMRVRSVIRAILRDSLGRILVLIYSSLYFISFLIVSGLLLIPGINVDRYLTSLTVISYEGSGISLIKIGQFYFILNPFILLFGLIVDVFLSISLMLSYYIVSLIYVSYHLYSFPVPKSFRIYTINTVGGFLTASVPSIGTIAGICCLTPTAINSLLYLASASLPLSKGITWKYGTFILGTWTGGVLQAIILASPVIAGVIISGISIYYIYIISRRLNEVVIHQ